MSGPVSPSDVPDEPRPVAPKVGDVEALQGRRAQVGGFDVSRVLPRRERRSVGAWCFVDQMGPGPITRQRGLDIGPHPHIGLQTVTWLLQGELLHRDSLGSEQVIRPAELNLMTAGHGVSRSEGTSGRYTGELHGVQLWLAQPASTRDGAPAFEHHAELPRLDIGRGVATVLVGDLAGVRSPARRDTEHVAVDVLLPAGRTVVPLEPSFEHALAVTAGVAAVGGTVLRPGQLGYLGPGRDEVPIDVQEPSRALLIGGAPFPEPLLMWWNYVARTRTEVIDAHREWMAAGERFGQVVSPLPRIVTSGPPWAAADG